jgi:hypothetical protein
VFPVCNQCFNFVAETEKHEAAFRQNLQVLCQFFGGEPEKDVKPVLVTSPPHESSPFLPVVAELKVEGQRVVNGLAVGDRPKRGRGRPRMAESEKREKKVVKSTGRPRGRPRKNPLLPHSSPAKKQRTSFVQDPLVELNGSRDFNKGGDVEILADMDEFNDPFAEVRIISLVSARFFF